jgi:hypothetical protein
MSGKILTTVNDSRLVEGRKPHRLSPVKFRILEGSEPDKAIPENRWQGVFSDINLVAQYQFELLGQRSHYGNLRLAP